MDKKDRDLIDQLKRAAVMLTERICQLEAFVSAGQPIPYTMVMNSDRMMQALSLDLNRLLMVHGAGVKKNGNPSDSEAR